MKKIFSFFFSIIMISCSSTKITVNEQLEKDTQNIDYKEFGKAINDAEFINAEQLAISSDEKLAVKGFKALFERKPMEAQQFFEQTEDTTYNFSQSVILPYYFRNYMYAECVSLAEKYQNNKYAICYDYSNLPEQTINISDKEIIVPIYSFNYGGTPIIEVKINGIVKKFIIDTGATHSIISQKIAKKCNVNTLQSKLSITDVNNKDINSQLGYADSLQIGDFLITNQSLVIMKKLSLKLLGITIYNIDGIIGWDILHKLKVRISWKDRNIAFSKSNAKNNNSRNLNAITQPFVTLKDDNGVKYYFHFDTGAKRTHLFEKASTKIKSSSSKHKSSWSFGLNSTKRTKVREYENIRFSIENKSFLFDKISLFPQSDYNGFINHDGRLGTDLFKNGTLEFDYYSGYLKYVE